MFKNYFITAWRNLLKNKFYSLINIAGLTIGLASALLVLLWVQDEKSFDTMHQDLGNIYNVRAQFEAGGKVQTWGGVPGPLFVYGKSIPQVQEVVRVADYGTQVLRLPAADKKFPETHIGYVDSNFFNVFDFKILQGDAQHPFPDMSAVLVTQSLAKRLFNTENVLGKTIAQDTFNFVISGVVADFPQNSSLRFDALFPMSFYGNRFTANGGNMNWKTIDEDLGNYAFDTYVKMKPGASIKQAELAFSAAYKKARNGDSKTQYLLQPMRTKHLVAVDGNTAGLRMVQIFTLISILLLIIAAINYINLSTARSLARAKEVSMRKIIGAGKLQLFFQFLIETVILYAIAAIAAFLLIILLMPAYNSISGKSMSFSLGNPAVWLLMGTVILGTLLASSIYPAIFLSSFDPLKSLKGKLTQSIGTGLLRKGLVVFQFFISVGLIICTIIISRQMKYVREMNLGYNKDYVFTVRLDEDAVNHVDAIKAELAKNTAIDAVSISSIGDMTNLGSHTGDISWPGKTDKESMIISQAFIDKEFIPLMKLQFTEGGNFNGTPADSSKYIVNETAVQQMGLKPPFVGQQLVFHDKPGTIAGVVKDFHFQSVKNKISPLLFSVVRYKYVLYVRTTAKNADKAIAAVGAAYKRYKTDVPFAYSFIDSQFDGLYKSDLRTGLLFNIFATIAILISCLGLLALATYTAQVRTKEIGVRKVLGASVPEIVRLLARDFIILVLIAIVIAVPVAWYGMDKWLQDFAYKTSIQGWQFILAGVIAVLIALCTISFQAVKAAVANPVKALRSE